jgi:LmbE family N-acetylglucosaminyl deacetylase
MRAADVLAAFRAFPIVPIDTLIGTAPVLALAPHPDDESLGCGGLLAERWGRGQIARVVFVTDGSQSHPGSRAWSPAAVADLREKEARAAAAALGGRPARDLSFLRLADSLAPHDGPAFEAAVSRIVAEGRAIEAKVVLAPWRRDPHGDHVATHRMAVRAARELGARHLAYPVWGWTLDDEAWAEPESGWRVDIGAQLDAKRRAVEAHESQNGRVISDDPNGFVLPPNLLAACLGQWEVYIDA